jgi:hypothetical protein
MTVLKARVWAALPSFGARLTLLNAEPHAESGQFQTTIAKRR